MRSNRYCCRGWLAGTSRKTCTQTIKKLATSNAPALISFPMTPPWSSSWLMSCVRNELRKKMDCRAKSKKLYHTSEQLKKKASSGTKTCVMREVAHWLAFKRGICVITDKHHKLHKSFLLHKNEARKSDSSNQYVKAPAYFPLHWWLLPPFRTSFHRIRALLRGNSGGQSPISQVWILCQATTVHHPSPLK